LPDREEEERWSMSPTICTIGPFTVYSYGLMLAVSFAVAVMLLRRQAIREGFNTDFIFNLAFIVFIAGVLGARFLYVLEHIGFYLEHPLEIILLQHGGLSWFGGLIAGIASGIIYLRKERLDVYRTADLVMPFIAIGQALGRIGCLLNGCCYGQPSLTGIYFKTHAATLIPTQLYSALAMLAIFVILRLLQERPHRTGEIFFTYLVLYSLKRFVIEFWRADNPVILSGLTLFQLFSIALFIFAFVKLIQIKKCRNSK